MARKARIATHAERQIGDDTIIDDILSKDRMTGFSTGYGSLDDILGGLRAGSCIVLGADTGIGKTVLGLNLLVNVAKNGNLGCYIDMENAPSLSYIRLMAIWFDKPLKWFDEPHEPQELKEMKAEIDLAIRYYSQKNLDEYEFGDQGISVISDIILTEIHNGIKFLLIDPLQSIEQSNNYQANLEIQGRFVEQMKNIAHDNKVVIMILHHLRKGGQGGQKIDAKDIDNLSEPICFMPSIDDFRGSNKITAFATQVWGMARPKGSKETKLREKCVVRVLKNRDGKTGDAKLRFAEERAKFLERENFSPKLAIFKNFVDSI